MINNEKILSLIDKKDSIKMTYENDMAPGYEENHKFKEPPAPSKGSKGKGFAFPTDSKPESKKGGKPMGFAFPIDD